MGLKMSGADFKAFIACKDEKFWPPGLYIEEETLRIDGVESELPAPDTYADSAVVEIIGGSLAWEESRERPTATLVALARRWLKAQRVTRIVISVPLENVPRLGEVLKSIGAEICK